MMIRVRVDVEVNMGTHPRLGNRHRKIHRATEIFKRPFCQ
jgi:hypothetical protein